MDNAEYMLKVIVAGDHLVGKTTFLERAASNRFIRNAKSTIGVDFQVFMSGDTKIQAWDLSGQQRFRKITEAYFKQCPVAILCYSDDVGGSRQNIMREWIPLLKEKCKDFKYYIVKLKTDMGSDDDSEFSVSAKRNSGYQDLFSTIVSDNMDKRHYIGYRRQRANVVDSNCWQVS